MSRMSNVFAPPPRSATAPSTNREGYPGFDRPLEEKFLQTLLTNTLGQSYYSSAKDLLGEAESIHLEMIARDPAFAAKAIVYARNRGFMRSQPIFALSLLASAPGDHFARAFPETIRTPGDLSDFATVMKARRGGEGGRRVKKTAGRWLASRLSEYWAIKYGTDRVPGGYSLRDLLQVYHPKFEAPSAIVDYLMGRDALSFEPVEGKVQPTMLDMLPQVAALHCLKTATTDEEKVRAITEGRIPHEQATPFAGSSKAVWRAIVPQMPIFALLKNLATIERHGIMDEVRDHVVKLITNADAVAKSKILPFRFVEAEKHVEDARVKDALRDAVELSFAQVPDVPGKTVVAVDISGSMNDAVSSERWGGPTRLEVAALFGVTLVRKAGDYAKLYLFDTQLNHFAVSMRDSILTQARRIQARGGTDVALIVKFLLQERTKVDNIVIVTDEQQNTGAPVVDVLDRYRIAVNRDVKVFILNVAPYTASASLPSSDPLTWFLYGFSDQALAFIGMAARGWGGLVEEIRRGSVTPDA